MLSRVRIKGCSLGEGAVVGISKSKLGGFKPHPGATTVGNNLKGSISLPFILRSYLAHDNSNRSSKVLDHLAHDRLSHFKQIKKFKKLFFSFLPRKLQLVVFSVFEKLECFCQQLLISFECTVAESTVRNLPRFERDDELEGDHLVALLRVRESPLESVAEGHREVAVVEVES